MTGVVFDIKEFSLFDGPGSRVTVFLKGCPLSCVWCHNPEGLLKDTQILYKKNKCVNCGKCKIDCAHPECRKINRCIYVCPNGCFEACGKEYTADGLAEKLLKYKDFLDISNGGITISGGEPLMQWEFVCELFKRLDCMHKAIQTSGYANEEVYQKVIDEADFVMQDIKLADTNKHKIYTGVNNEKILKNIEYLKKSKKDFVFRVPLIPDITDTDENLIAISEIVGSHKVELLSYNQMAGAKYESVGMKYLLDDKKANEKKDYMKFFENAVIK